MSKKIIKAKALQTGDKIDVLVCCGPIEHRYIQSSFELLEEQGFKPRLFQKKLSKQQIKQHAYVQGSANQRQNILTKALARPKSAAIVFARGGFGMMHLLPFDITDAIQICEHKVIMGLSDVTPFLNWYSYSTGRICLHGPMPVTKQFTQLKTKHKKYLVSLLTDPKEQMLNKLKDFKVFNGQAMPIKNMRLWGGNVCLLAASVGTAYEVRPKKNECVFLEEVGEPAYKIDRTLEQLFASAYFKHCACILLGDFTDSKGKFHNEQWLMKLLKSLLKRYDLDIPIVYGLKSGHVHADIIWPIGGHVQFEGKANKVLRVESLVE